jgi:hypothetical protein
MIYDESKFYNVNKYYVIVCLFKYLKKKYQLNIYLIY